MAVSLSNAADCHISSTACFRSAHLYIILGSIYLQAA